MTRIPDESDNSDASDNRAELALVEQTARDILRDVAGQDPTKAWQLLTEAGLPLLAVPEPDGGGWLEAAAVVTRLVGESGTDVPYGDAALVAAPVLAGAGLPLPQHGFAVGIVAEDATVTRAGGGLRLRATLPRVPWGAAAEQVVVVASGEAGDVVVALDPSLADVTPGRNIAGEPRDTMRVDAVVD